jgi:site-specific DNA recombinase
MKAAIYARTAFPDQSTLPQINLCREYIHEQKGEVIGIYDDEGASAHDMNRDGLACLMEAATERHFDTLVVTALDKLVRDPAHRIELLNRFELRGISVVVVKTMAQSE